MPGSPWVGGVTTLGCVPRRPSALASMYSSCRRPGQRLLRRPRPPANGSFSRVPARWDAAQRLHVTDPAGVLVRVLTVPRGEIPTGGWTLASIRAAVRAGFARVGRLSTDAYTPTAAIREHVHVRNPSCDFHDCARSARRSDLDHGIPHPQGPTDVENLHPRCRRHHEHKTKRRWAATYDPATVTTTWTSPTGHRYATRPPPLPGCPDLVPVPAETQ